MSQENVEIVRQAYEAWNRGDLEWLLDRITPDYEFRTAQLFPDTEAVYRGREGLTGSVASRRGQTGKHTTLPE
jgi:ketosteroid isomerase-like protein